MTLTPMTTPILFYFDFSSPYGYLASQQIDALAARHGRTVDWRPMLLGVAFKQTGSAPLTSVPIKGEYAKRDFARTARHNGLEFRMPSRFPIPGQAPSRIVLWQKQVRPQAAVAVAKALYRAYFVADRDISDPDIAADVASEAGADRAAARAAIDDPAMKDALRREVDGAIAQGVFGSPFVIVDGEPFWGFDRFEQIDRWLATGGF
jgi:2-hydroxychromene-2-carboxylate isomerase